MQQIMNKIHFLTGNTDMLQAAAAVPALPTWSDEAVELLSAFSQNLLKDSRSCAFPDIVSYAFWIRKSSLIQIKEHYYPNVEDKVGRGVAFHIAPSNVPINFAVSFTSSFLAGNVNIVRLSNKPYDQVSIMVDALKKAFQDTNKEMENYLILMRYEHDTDITQYLSSLCDVRIIWGGNQTIRLIKQTQIPPRAVEMAFADRHSIALLQSEEVLRADINKLAENFYTDTYYIDQNACSSPRIVVWMGDHINAAQEKFWPAVEKLAKEKYDMKEIQVVDKLNQFCCLAANHKDVFLTSNNNRVMRIKTDDLDTKLMDYKLGGGYFFEYAAESMDELVPLMNKPCQTVAYYGVEPHSIQKFVITHGLRGVDRVVPVGKTMDLTFKWDGFDMIEQMSRYVYCPDYNFMMETR